MNWTRYKTLIITGILTLIACGGLFFWMTRSRSQSSELTNDINRLKSRQASLVSEKIYPSEANYKRLIVEQERVEKRRDRLLTLLREGQVEPVPMTRDRFGDFIRSDYVPGLRQAARQSTRGGENGVIIADATFGLGTYLEGNLPDARRVPDLMLQLETMQNIAEMLFNAGISELVALTPAEVEEDEEDARRPNRRLAGGGLGALAGPASRPDASPEEDEDTGRVQQEKDRMFEVLKYRVEFRVYEDFLWDLLNRMLANTNQIVIENITITNSNELLWPEYLSPVVRAQSATDDRRKRQNRDRQLSELERQLLAMEEGGVNQDTEEDSMDDSSSNLPGLKARRRYVSGGELLNVAMELNVYRLRDEPLETTEGR